MHQVRTLAVALVSIALIWPMVVFAHEPGKGHNGGLRVDAGKYHVEILADGSTNFVVFLSDAEDKPISATGFKAQAILVVDGKSVRFPLEVKEGSKFVGAAPVPVPAGVKGVVRLTTPEGETAQGKF